MIEHPERQINKNVFHTQTTSGIRSRMCTEGGGVCGQPKNSSADALSKSSALKSSRRKEVHEETKVAGSTAQAAIPVSRCALKRQIQ